mmetsp:Transcript_6861/g.31209  ORF Transcript_6861/g.31209 Transcript_6861/m.31209 type:complete len:289 (+) Transcript_6861:43-909(+)
MFVVDGDEDEDVSKVDDGEADEAWCPPSDSVISSLPSKSRILDTFTRAETRLATTGEYTGSNPSLPSDRTPAAASRARRSFSLSFSLSSSRRFLRRSRYSSMLFLTARRGRSLSGPLDEPSSKSLDLSATRAAAESGSVNSTVSVQSAVSAAATGAAAAGPASESEETSDFRFIRRLDDGVRSFFGFRIFPTERISRSSSCRSFSCTRASTSATTFASSSPRLFDLFSRPHPRGDMRWTAGGLVGVAPFRRFLSHDFAISFAGLRTLSRGGGVLSSFVRAPPRLGLAL